MLFDQNDVESMALCAWKEARGDGIFACFLVMCVIYNRVGKLGFAHTIHDVIYGKNQFTSMSVPSDSQFNLEPPPGDTMFAACKVDATNILGGANNDPTHGALYYANEDNIDIGGWYDRNIIQKTSHPVLLKYKHHTFRA